MNVKDPRFLEIHKILNDPGTTWKIRRALLRAIGIDEKSIQELVPKDPDHE